MSITLRLFRIKRITPGLAIVTLFAQAWNWGRRMQISCREVRKELANYLEDDIDEELRTRIERHFRECEGCNALYDSIREIVQLVGSTEIIELPVGFSRRLYSRLFSN